MYKNTRALEPRASSLINAYSSSRHIASESYRVTEGQSLAMALAKQVVLSAYDCAWPGKFTEDLRWLRILSNDKFIAIKHISSTAIPGFSAKPAIDFLASV